MQADEYAAISRIVSNLLVAGNHLEPKRVTCLCRFGDAATEEPNAGSPDIRRVVDSGFNLVDAPA